VPGQILFVDALSLRQRYSAHEQDLPPRVK